MKPKQKRIYFSVFILTLIFLIAPFFIDYIWARPGGGHSFSGGSGGSYSGGGDGEGLGLLIYLIFNVLPPQISIPLLIGIVIGYYYLKRKNKQDGTTVLPNQSIESRVNNSFDVESGITALKNFDPNFSKVLFLDFVASIFNKYYTWYGTAEFKNLSPFISPGEIEKSNNMCSAQSITEIVIGSMHISEVNIMADLVGLSVDINANYTMQINSRKTRYILSERWYFNRSKQSLSPEPEKMRKLSCLSCGAPAHFTDKGNCESCGTKINLGEMQWFVKKHIVMGQEVFRTSGLAHYEAETGTNLPTLYQDTLRINAQQFAQKHNTDWNVWKNNFVDKVVKEYFLKIYAAWSKNKLDNVRSLLSDRLYESFIFWIKTYKSAGLVNKLEKIQIQNIQFVRLDLDKFYEAVTLRIFASSLDYVVDFEHKIKGGSNKRLRSYSEYWTFIRRSGVEKDDYDYASCPNCGAPADKVGQAGVCEYCNTKITNGDFSWVLAVISQDEAYTG